MDARKNCIVLFDKRLNCYVDKSNEISDVKYDSINCKIVITFINGKTYEYNSTSVEWLTRPNSLEVSDKIVYFQNKRLTNIKEILDFGSWIKIIFENNSIRSYPTAYLKIVRDRKEDIAVKSVRDYLKEVSDIVKDTFDEQSGFLRSELERIEVNDENILSKFIDKAPIIEKKDNDTLIFPFATNASQIKAVNNALKYNISTIQGPPGTGKTHTILNIIANLLIRDKTVAVVSGNNEATRNVQEKLAKANLSSICAFLGNKENIEEFFKELNPYIPTFDINPEELTDIKRFRELSVQAEKIYKYRVRGSEISHEIFEYTAEKEKNDLRYKQSKHIIPHSLRKWNKSAMTNLKLAAYIETLLTKKRVNLIDRIKLKWSFKIRGARDILKKGIDCIDYLQNRFYYLKIEELKNEQKYIQKFLDDADNKKILSDFEQLSFLILKRSLFAHFSQTKNADQFKLETYRLSFADFVKRYPVIFSTTHALRYCSGNNYLYDYVIVDESSQVDLISAVVAMSCAKNVVFVGDLKQLPPVIKSRDRQALKEVFDKYELPRYLDYSKNSILQCVTTEYGSALPNVLLNEHYRCDPQIIEFCNKRFYNGELRVQTTHQVNNGLTIISAQSHSAIGRKNTLQAEIIKQEIIPKVDSGNVGIIAPYCDQVELISKMLSDDEGIVDTVHKFQGKERDTMILSTVADKVVFYEDDERYDFLNNDNLINVALTRAKNLLYVVVSKAMLGQKGSLMNELASYATYYCGSLAIKESNVYSIFELMYDDYSPILNKLKQRLLHISKNQSENIVATVLQDICDSGKYGRIAFKFNYPLYKVIDSDALSDVEDKQFVNNVNTHCDFVIYNKIDKSIRLVLEVDGKQHIRKVQRQRDERKDRLLNAADIAVLRLSTTDVDCENKIKQALSTRP